MNIDTFLHKMNVALASFEKNWKSANKFEEKAYPLELESFQEWFEHFTVLEVDDIE